MRQHLCLIGLVSAVLLPASTARPQVVPTPTPAGPDHGRLVHDRLSAIAQAAAKDGDFKAAADAADAVFAYVVAYVPSRQDELFTDAAFARRLYRQLADCDQQTARDLLSFLQQNDALARTLAFLVDERERAGEVYGVLNTLREKRGDKLPGFATLTAALCVVMDRPLARQINENRVEAPDAVALFDYFTENERKMLFGLKPVPAELLVWTVDSTASIDQMNWALDHYAGDRNVGKLFFNVHYDYDHLRTGKPKQVTTSGYTLENILKFGGVCVDQAYFATEVGKAIGVPTAFATAQSGEVGHAWVGFLQAQGRSAAWNFNVGRYSAYQGIRGNVTDPQTRQTIPDSYVSVLAELVGTKPAQRWAAAAFVDAAAYLRDQTESFRPARLAEEPGDSSVLTPRSTDTNAQLDLIEAGLRQTPGYSRGWFALTALAEDGGMSLSQKKKWAGLLQRMCGANYPDFTMAVLSPMIASIQDADEQMQLWEAAFKLFRRRADLCAEVRIAQGKLWESLDEPAKAGQCYEDVIRRFANDGPFVITALEKTEQMLAKAGKADRTVKLYQTTWAQITPPDAMAAAFASQSNYYRVGMMYAKRLEEAGQADEATRVREQIRRQIGV